MSTTEPKDHKMGQQVRILKRTASRDILRRMRDSRLSLEQNIAALEEELSFLKHQKDDTEERIKNVYDEIDELNAEITHSEGINHE